MKRSTSRSRTKIATITQSMKAGGLDKKQVAELLHVDVTTVYKWLRFESNEPTDKREPPMMARELLAMKLERKAGASS